MRNGIDPFVEIAIFSIPNALESATSSRKRGYRVGSPPLKRIAYSPSVAQRRMVSAACSNGKSGPPIPRQYGHLKLHRAVNNISHRKRREDTDAPFARVSDNV